MPRHSVALVCGLAVVVGVLVVVHLLRRMLRIPTREDREWAEIEEALYGPRTRAARQPSGRLARPPRLPVGAAQEAVP